MSKPLISVIIPIYKVEPYLRRCVDSVISQTYEFVIENMMGGSFKDIRLIPDLVLYLDKSKEQRDREGVLFCLRGDKEKVFDGESLQKITEVVGNLNQQINYTDTLIGKHVGLKNHKLELDRKLSEFQSSKLVITDRLHAMIFSTVTGTPCIAFNNISKKVEGVYEWIRYLPYIVFANNVDEAIPHIRSLLEMGGQNYDNSPLMPYYNELSKMLEGSFMENPGRKKND